MSSRDESKINCYGNRSTSDVVISLVRSAAPVLVDEKPAAGEMVLPSLPSAHDKGKGPVEEEPTADCLTTKRKRDAEEENKEDCSKEIPDTTLAEFHVHRKRLCRSSRYFEACLSERWSGGETSDGVQSPRRLSLEAHVPVKYYKECIHYMYVPCLGDVDVRQCLKLVRAALQIDYQALVQECRDYLAGIEWTSEDEWRIRRCASTSHFPISCAADGLSSRLGSNFSASMRKNVLDHYESVLSAYFGKDVPVSLFTTTFQRVVKGRCHTISEVFFGFLNNKIKKGISNAVGTAKLRSECADEATEDMLSTERYMLQLLLLNKRAREVVEYIVEESDLHEALKTKQFTPWDMDWAGMIDGIMSDVIEGRLVLGASTRYKLITNYTWLLVVRFEQYLRARETVEIFCKFIMTFPREEQLKLMNLEDLRRNVAFYHEANEMWIKGFEYKICSLEEETKYCVDFPEESQSIPSVSDASGDSRLSDDGSFHSLEFNSIDGAHPDAGWPEVEVTSSHLG